MKTISTRTFYHRPALVNALRPGQKVVVTDKGQPKFTVTRTETRPIKRKADLQREAKEICAKDKPKLNFTEFLQSIR
jgi:hypothetical protein